MTKLEMAAIALANEIESCVRIGVPLTTAAINALDQFRKTQIEADKLLGADLDEMYKRYQQSTGSFSAEQPKNIADLRRLKSIKLVELENSSNNVTTTGEKPDKGE